MNVIKLLSGAAFVAGLGVSSFVSAQGTNGLNVPAAAPLQIAPTDGSVVDSPNPTFEWEVVSNADLYRLFMINDTTGVVNRYVFRTDGLVVFGAGDPEVCASAVVGTCDFTPTDLNLADGDSVRWLIGARNRTVGQTRFANSPRWTFTHQTFGAPATALVVSDLYSPRGNLSADDGTVRQAGSGPLNFHWANKGDATNFLLEIETNPEGNVLSSVSFTAAEANCTTTSGLFDACTFSYDPEANINNNANDFCWRVTPMNATGLTSDVSALACYAAE